jgi:hypothetical protein
VSNDAYSRAGRQTSGAAVGFILFAAIMLIMSGVFQALQGLVAIFENEFYVATRNYLFQFDATTWGWIHLLVGLLVAFAGWGLLSGRTWARGRGHHRGRAQRDRQLPMVALLPVLGAAHHRGGRVRHLGHRRSWPGSWGLTVAGRVVGMARTGKPGPRGVLQCPR